MILVTGGAGFIGSHIAEELEDAVVLDDMSTANRHSRGFVEESGPRLVKGSVTDLKLLKELLEGVETVYHQAAIPSVPRSVKDPLTTNRVNVGGTLTLLKACADSGVKSIVYASSSSVYGDTPTLPKAETMKPDPKSPYAVSKLAGEHYMRVFSELHGLNAASLRYFNVYGPRQDPHSQYAAVVPKFVTAALSGKPLTVYGDGSQTRDFTFVKDVVAANRKAAGRTGVYNIAGGRQITIQELAEKILELTGSESEIRHLPEREGDIKHSLADVSKAGKELGWKPETSLEEGLRSCVDYYRPE